MFKSIKNKTAFTLAEVLITLLIIGVVAGIVVPNLIQDTQQAEFIAAWKKSYGVIMQAQLNMVREYGSVNSAFSGIEDSADGANNFMNGWLPYLVVVKKCTAGQIINNGCYPESFKSLDGSALSDYNALAHDCAVVLNDGTFINFYVGVCDAALCNDAYLFIDVNGSKKPNTFGKDVFIMRYQVNKDRFIPGSSGVSCSGAGWNCGAYYLFH